MVWSICEDQAGYLWNGTSNGLNKFDRTTGVFTHYHHDHGDPTSLSTDFIPVVIEDRNGVLWVGADEGGLNRFDRATESFTAYRHDPDDPISLSDDDVWSLYEDSQGTLWLGTNGGGLNRFDRETETFSHYRHDPADPDSLSDNVVRTIYADRTGLLWIGVDGGGLNKFDRQTETFSHYREKDGLVNDTIYGMLEDDEGNLWLSTNNGLSKFNPQTETFKNYNASVVLTSMNHTLVDRVGKQLLTAGYAYINLETGKLFHASAGHWPLLLWNKESQSLQKLKPDGIIMSWLPEIDYVSAECDLEPGDRILLYTDAIIETRNSRGELFGEDRFHRLIQEKQALSAGEFADFC
jgi:ligand-binding sensor domain-containing protein